MRFLDEIPTRLLMIFTFIIPVVPATAANHRALSVESQGHPSCNWNNDPICELSGHNGWFCSEKMRNDVHVRCDEPLAEVRRIYDVPDISVILEEAMRADQNWDIFAGNWEHWRCKNCPDGIMITKDNKYVFEEFEDSDFKVFSDVVEKYVAYISVQGRSAEGPDTMLPIIFGIIKCHHGKRWLVRNNLMPLDYPNKHMYDLKGARARSNGGSVDMMQHDYEAISQKLIIRVPNHIPDQDSVHAMADSLVSIMEADTQWIYNQNQFSYSLLVGQEIFHLPTCTVKSHESSLAEQSELSLSDLRRQHAFGDLKPEPGSWAANKTSFMRRKARTCSAAACGRNGKDGTLLCVDVADKSDQPELWTQVKDAKCIMKDGKMTARKTQLNHCFLTIHPPGPTRVQSEAEVSFTCFGIDDLFSRYSTTTWLKDKLTFNSTGLQLVRSASLTDPWSYKERFDAFVKGTLFGEFGAKRADLPVYLYMVITDHACAEWATMTSVIAPKSDEAKADAAAYADREKAERDAEAADCADRDEFSDDEFDDLFAAHGMNDRGKGGNTSEAAVTTPVKEGSKKAKVTFVVLVVGAAGFLIIVCIFSLVCSGSFASKKDESNEKEDTASPAPSRNCNECGNTGAVYTTGRPCVCDAGVQLLRQSQGTMQFGGTMPPSSGGGYSNHSGPNSGAAW